MRRSCSLALLSSMALATACESPFNPSEAALTTPESSYQLIDYPDRIEVSIPYQFRNESGRTLFIPRCGDPVDPILEARTEDGWVPAFDVVYACGAMPPLKLPHGMTRQGVVRVVGLKAPDLPPDFSVPDGGADYRLVLTVFTTDPSEGSAEQLPVTSRATEAFRITDRHDLTQVTR